MYIIVLHQWNVMGYTESPFPVFKRSSILEPDLISAEIFIAAEQKIIVKLPTGCMIEAIKCLHAECVHLYIFMQMRFSKLFDPQKVPTKVMMLMSELLKLQLVYYLMTSSHLIIDKLDCSLIDANNIHVKYSQREFILKVCFIYISCSCTSVLIVKRSMYILHWYTKGLVRSVKLH